MRHTTCVNGFHIVQQVSNEHAQLTAANPRAPRQEKDIERNWASLLRTSYDEALDVWSVRAQTTIASGTVLEVLRSSLLYHDFSSLCDSHAWSFARAGTTDNTQVKDLDRFRKLPLTSNRGRRGVPIYYNSQMPSLCGVSDAERLQHKYGSIGASVLDSVSRTIQGRTGTTSNIQLQWQYITDHYGEEKLAACLVTSQQIEVGEPLIKRFFLSSPDFYARHSSQECAKFSLLSTPCVLCSDYYTASLSLSDQFELLLSDGAPVWEPEIGIVDFCLEAYIERADFPV